MCSENLGPSLLGRECISNLKLNALELGVASAKIEVEQVESAELNSLRSEFEDVFGDDMGNMKDFQATLQLK